MSYWEDDIADQLPDLGMKVRVPRRFKFKGFNADNRRSQESKHSRNARGRNRDDGGITKAVNGFEGAARKTAARAVSDQPKDNAGPVDVVEVQRVD